MGMEQLINEKHGVKKGDRLYDPLTFIERYNPELQSETPKSTEPEVEYELVARVNGERVHYAKHPLAETLQLELNLAERAVEKKIHSLVSVCPRCKTETLYESIGICSRCDR